MTYDVVIKELPAQLALTVRSRVSVTAIPQAMGEAFDAIMKHIASGKAQYAGPPFSFYPSEPTDEIDIVVCMPVAPGATAGPGVGLEEIPGGTVASTMHKGPYSQIAAAYEAVQVWMAASGKRPGTPMREVYLNSPGEVPDEELLTEIDWPLA